MKSGRLKVLLAICTRNRVDTLSNCLRSVAGLEAPADADVRVLIIDNSEEAATRRENEAAVTGSWGPFAISVEHEPKLGISFGRNRGLETALRAGDDAIVFLDDDQTVPEDWLAQLIRIWRDDGSDALKSNFVILPRHRYSEYDADTLQRLEQQLVSGRRERKVRTLATNGVLIARRVFDELGLRFDPNFALTGGGDHEFFNRARVRGAKLALTYEIVAFEWRSDDRRSLRARMKRGFHLGVCSARLRHLKDRSAASLIGGGLWLVLSGLVALPTAIFHRKKLGNVLKRAAKGFGYLAGLAGYRFQYYRTVTT